MKGDQLDKMLQSGIVAVIRKIERQQISDVISALVEGGITGIEVTVDSEDAFGAISEAKKRYGSSAVIGAGTVLDGETAKMAIHAGADFLFSPTLCEETIRVSNRYGKIAIPGVFTPTEIIKAYEWGADLVKVFPASVLGPEFIKDVRGPLPHVPMMPTGGITLDNVADYIRAGAVAAGVGGSLLKKELLISRDMRGLTELADQFVTIIKNTRSSTTIKN
jgi:2-dehydro-3-deoxyphosphogluconate aldolase / (4S)-4-hydroxy-2-oxoglutarate aldolase